MKTNRRALRTVESSPVLRPLDPKPVNRLGRTEYRRRVPDFSPMPMVQEQEAETDASAPTQSEPPASDSTASGLTLYLREIGRVKLLSREEEAALARRIQGGDEAAREQMIKANLRMVVTIAHDFDYMGLPLLDLISEGNIGLMKAVDRFDPVIGTRLSTYAYFLIKSSMRQALSHHARTIRMPQHVFDKFQTIHSAAGRLSELLGRDPTNDEIAQETGLPAAWVQRTRAAAQATVSLDAPLNGSEERLIAEVVPGENPTTAEEAFADAATVQNLGEFIGQLSPREQSVLRFRFGLGCAEEKSMGEIGRLFGLTRERVRQIQDSALQKLRKKYKAQKLQWLAARCAMCRWDIPS
jgi:RNA polymerase primary sigma factor